jgi:hypothetical protein
MMAFYGDDYTRTFVLLTLQQVSRVNYTFSFSGALFCQGPVLQPGMAGGQQLWV